MHTYSEKPTNIRGCIFMLIAMASFALEDMFIKSAAEVIPLGFVILGFGIIGALIYFLVMIKNSDEIFPPEALSKVMLVRVICEIAGRSFFALAIVLIPLSTASAILQATPLVVVIGASLFLHEKVAFSHWVAILLGFIGVIMIVRPGMESFTPASLCAVAGTIGFAGRDLATRAASPSLSNAQLGFYGFLVLIAAGICLSLVSDSPFQTDAESSMKVIGATVFGVIAYSSLTVAMRSGSVAVVVPFRYSRVIFALILGFIIFDERPDLFTLAGTLIVILSGIYILFTRTTVKHSTEPHTEDALHRHPR